METFAGVASDGEAILPKDIRGLLELSVQNLLLFAIIFGLTWALGRTNRDELFLRWPDWWQPWVLGAGYSVALRLLAAVVTLGVIAVLYVIFQATGKDPHSLEQLRPKVENLISFEALRDPLYLLLACTLLSFIVAGLREELWRAGVVSYFTRLLPVRWQNWRGQALAVVVTSVVFGLGHWPQGPAGVILTTTIGLGLGAVMVFHRSLWIAVMAHGFFDASTFVMLRVLDHYKLLDQLIPA